MTIADRTEHLISADEGLTALLAVPGQHRSRHGALLDSVGDPGKYYGDTYQTGPY